MAKGAGLVVRVFVGVLAVLSPSLMWCGWGQADESREPMERPTAEEAVTSAERTEELEAEPNESVWLTDYAAAVQAARSENSMLLIWFVDPGSEVPGSEDPGSETSQHLFQRDILADSEVQGRLKDFTCVQIPISATWGSANSEAMRLIDHPAFAELTGEPGLAILDLTDETSPYFHHVVSIYPLESRQLTVEQMVALLDLPPGSLTQRTLIWAVWTHPERPLSASGEPHEELEREAESHSRHQAVIRVQGHHRWGSRFQRLLGRIPPGHVPQEVCAESWPGQRLIDAAEECVQSWRHSSGHWDAVRRHHPIFGYDMKRGSNGIWYATGVFGRRS